MYFLAHPHLPVPFPKSTTDLAFIGYEPCKKKDCTKKIKLRLNFGKIAIQCEVPRGRQNYLGPRGQQVKQEVEGVNAARK